MTLFPCIHCMLLACHLYLQVDASDEVVGCFRTNTHFYQGNVPMQPHTNTVNFISRLTMQMMRQCTRWRGCGLFPRKFCLLLWECSNVHPCKLLTHLCHTQVDAPNNKVVGCFLLIAFSMRMFPCILVNCWLTSCTPRSMHQIMRQLFVSS